jgi:hypothetical protein
MHPLLLLDKGVVDDEQHWLFDCDALGGIRQNHASTIERYSSLPELMAFVYDRSPAMAAYFAPGSSARFRSASYWPTSLCRTMLLRGQAT